MSQWSEVLSAEQLDARYAKVSKLDPSFAAKQRRWYDAQSKSALISAANGAWMANDPEGYQLARSHAALK